MGLLNLRLNYNASSAAIHSPFSFNNHSCITLSSAGGREATFNSARLSSLSTVNEEGEASQRSFPTAFSCLSSELETLDNDSLYIEEIKVKKGKRSISSVQEMLNNTQRQRHFEKEISTACLKFQSFRAIHYRLLMENLGTLEQTFADSEAIKLKSDIVLQLGKLGALELFNVCLSRSLELSSHAVGLGEHQKENRKIDEKIDKVFVQSTRKKQNKRRTRKAFTAMEVRLQPLTSKVDDKEYRLHSLPASVKKASNRKNTRIMVARREAEMSKGVKVLAELEKIREGIEESTNQVASLKSWAEAAGVHEKVLQQKLHYCQRCRDELIRSTRSLVVYLARKYRGMGIALEDLLQAGYIGVLQGAVRFDYTRGYRFSTYVQYWIRKSISRMVERYAREIVVPWSLSRAMNQIQKAQKSLKMTSMKSPDDHEIAKATGLSLEKIRSAGNCLRVVASTNQKMGDSLSVKYTEFMPDMSIENPEEAVMKQHMRKDLYDLLKVLDSREREILTLRFGLRDHHSKSLEEIGRYFKVSKECVRKIERKALTKLRNKAATSNFNFYLLDLDS
ncbi:RNA polymerase sigma factor sigC [Arachis duranensis]|uniref:RNA polymerase sigma factor sigC n=1 Tax=Arachis duranensis TaxID=130453 RepID=A0A6P4B760_ARADU|nr:RNA polymerase sigma factor sigC [Arachis duranensis]